MTLFVVGFENRSSRRNTFSSYHWTVISYHWPRPILTKRKLLTMKRTEKDNQSFADQLEDRLINFAVRIIRLSARLPRTPAGKHVAGQILRSGTSPAPNYGEAQGAESNADFIHKIRVVLKELNETSIWLRIIERSHMLPTSLLVDLIQEKRELCRIFTASLKTFRDFKN